MGAAVGGLVSDEREREKVVGDGDGEGEKEGEGGRAGRVGERGKLDSRVPFFSFKQVSDAR